MIMATWYIPKSQYIKPHADPLPWPRVVTRGHVAVRRRVLASRCKASKGLSHALQHYRDPWLRDKHESLAGPGGEFQVEHTGAHLFFLKGIPLKKFLSTELRPAALLHQGHPGRIPMEYCMSMGKKYCVCCKWHRASSTVYIRIYCRINAEFLSMHASHVASTTHTQSSFTNLHTLHQPRLKLRN